MALNRKKLLKAVKEACAIFGAVAAMVGVILLIIYAVEYFGLPNYVIGITIFVPMFIFIVVSSYKDQ
jgi:hypothetical protein